MSYNKKQVGTVYMNPLVAIIGIVGLIFFGIMLVISIREVTIFGIIVFGFFSLLSIIMILTINQRIDYTPLEFTYRDLFRICHKYDYAQIKKIKYGKDVFIYLPHRIILIDSMAENGKKFARIAMQYSKDVKIIKDSDVKIFRGNVKSPGEFIFVYILIALMPIGMSVWISFETLEIRLDTLKVYSGTIADYQFDMSNEDSERIAIKFNNNDCSFVSWELNKQSPDFLYFENDVKANKVFSVYYPDEDEKEEMIIIYQLSCENRDYINLEKRNEHNREIRSVVIIISGIMFAFWMLYVVSSIYVMRNAEKYPHLIKLFVKSDYIINKKKSK
ncbi:MAG: hypothetical protein K2H28_09815 [Ruminococcus sp.]|nr:hypothetical protein [Ruminococcus sp.]